MQGKTVVSIQIGRVFDAKLPAITVCPGGLRADKLVQMNKRYKELIDELEEYVRRPNNSLHPERMYFNIPVNVLKDMKSGLLNFDIYDMMTNYTYPYLDD